jgi:hypothetical protein
LRCCFRHFRKPAKKQSTVWAILVTLPRSLKKEEQPYVARWRQHACQLCGKGTLEAFPLLSKQESPHNTKHTRSIEENRLRGHLGRTGRNGAEEKRLRGHLGRTGRNGAEEKRLRGHLGWVGRNNIDARMRGLVFFKYFLGLMSLFLFSHSMLFP